jgi:hypothetical protein
MPFGAADQSLRDVDIVLSTGVTELEGMARDGRDRPAADATIVVFATDRSLWYSGSRFVEIAGTVIGKFLISSLPPGEYFVAAVDGSLTAGLEDRLDDRRFLENLTGNAVRVTLKKGERTTVNVRTR